MNFNAIADFLFEVGMLKRTPRTGFQFLGTGHESVADHSLRCAIIGYALARMAPEADLQKVVLMCLFHDLAEARTGDHNYVNKKYVTSDEKAAISDMTDELPFGAEIRDLTDELQERTSLEAALTHDADQLELILQLKELGDLGNPYCKDWISAAIKRLSTAHGKKLARSILSTEFCNWWFKEREDEWWVNGSQQAQARDLKSIGKKR
ncbi:MAG: HD domain-containing protein [Thermodesulfobacteriota bacterium]